MKTPISIRNTLPINPKQFRLALGCTLLFVLLAAGCVQQSRGFVLPEGDIAQGKLLFETLSCNQCHTISDIQWAGTEGNPHIQLGGEVTTIKTYGELVTSVINPSHKIAAAYQREIPKEVTKSPMEAYSYNEVMTVEELTNIVTFLQSEYKVVTPEDYYYTGR